MLGKKGLFEARKTLLQACYPPLPKVCSLFMGLSGSDAQGVGAVRTALLGRLCTVHPNLNRRGVPGKTETLSEPSHQPHRTCLLRH